MCHCKETLRQCKKTQMRKNANAADSGTTTREDDQDRDASGGSGTCHEQEQYEDAPINNNNNKRGNAKTRRRSSPSSSSSSKNQVQQQQQQQQGPVLSRKVCSALHEDILSLCKDVEQGLVPDFTSFSFSEESNLSFIVQRMRKECPNLCKDKEELIYKLLDMLPDHS